MADVARVPAGIPAAAAASSVRRAARGLAQQPGGTKSLAPAGGCAKRRPVRSADSARFSSRAQPKTAAGSASGETPHRPSIAAPTTSSCSVQKARDKLRSLTTLLREVHEIGAPKFNCSCARGRGRAALDQGPLIKGRNLLGLAVVTAPASRQLRAQRQEQRQDSSRTSCGRCSPP